MLPQSRPGVPQSQALTAAVERRPVVVYRNPQPAVLERGRQLDHAGQRPPGDPVTNGILDQRLDEQIGNKTVERVGRCGNADGESIGEAERLDREIALEEVDLLTQRHLVAAGLVEREAQERRRAGRACGRRCRDRREPAPRSR